MDAGGEKALRTPRPAGQIKDLAAYKVAVVADRRLTLVVRGMGGEKLEPAELYTPHWMTGGYVVYINCATGYEIETPHMTPPEATLCALELGGCIVNPTMRNVRISFVCRRPQ
jgi:hypothetical protein